jgi:FdhD protein
MADPPVERVRAWVVREGSASPSETDEWVSAEEPLEIRVESPSQTAPVSVAVTMRTPGHEAELAVGFLFTEGLLRSRDELARPPVREMLPGAGPCNVVTVRMNRAFDADSLRRNFYSTSSCGVCGKASIDQVERAVTKVTTEVTVSGASLRALPEKLSLAQAQFAQTGGLHAVGLFTLDGELELAREDVGRHNAMDKAIGRRVLDGSASLGETVVMASGRLSFELVQKVAMAGAPVLCAVSAPSSLAVRAAERFGLTLVGFVREGRFTVYTGRNRVT